MTIRRYDIGSLAERKQEVFRHPDSMALFEMWDALRGDRPAPFRAELDAGKIGARAPFLAIFEQVGDTVFRTRIAGDRLNRWFGLELRGMSALSLATPACRNHLQATLNRVTSEPAAAICHGAAVATDGRSAGFEFALLPMRSDFGPVDRVLLGMWLSQEEAAPTHPIRLRIDEIGVAPLADGDPDATPLPQADASPDAPEPQADAETSDAAPDASLDAAAPARPVRRGHLRLVISNSAPPQRRK